MFVDSLAGTVDSEENGNIINDIEEDEEKNRRRREKHQRNMQNRTMRNPKSAIHMSWDSHRGGRTRDTLPQDMNVYKPFDQRHHNYPSSSSLHKVNKTYSVVH